MKNWKEMQFNIGDIVEIVGEDYFMEVTGVIHDSHRLFVTNPENFKEKEYGFSSVLRHWMEMK